MSGTVRPTHFRAPLAVAALLAGVLLFATAADAGKGKSKISSPSSVTVVGGGVYPPDTLVVYGEVGAGHKRCIDNRKLKVRIYYDDSPPVLMDVARSGSTGAWSAAGDPGLVDGPNLDAITATAAKRKVKLSKNKQLVCKKASGNLPLDMD